MSVYRDLETGVLRMNGYSYNHPGFNSKLDAFYVFSRNFGYISGYAY